VSQSNIIPVDFASRVPLSATEARAVTDATALAVLLLHRELRREVIAEFQDRRVGFAHVTGGAYRLGISVGVYSSVKGRRPPEMDLREWIAKRDIAPRVLAVDVTADAEWLRDSALATEGDFGSEYANPEVASVEDAVAWIRKNCLRTPVDRVSSGELLAWEEKIVSLPQPDGKGKKVSLAFAVKVYGPLYKHEICAATIIHNHGIAAADAKAIVAAVKKVLPRKK